jgi:hypothetical protein
MIFLEERDNRNDMISCFYRHNGIYDVFGFWIRFVCLSILSGGIAILILSLVLFLQNKK